MGKEIIDYSVKGNIVRFYLGEKDPKWGWTNKYCKYYDKNDLEPSDDYYGDDWNDVPYEHNAGTVYPEFIKATIDVSFGYDDVVIEPSSITGLTTLTVSSCIGILIVVVL